MKKCIKKISTFFVLLALTISLLSGYQSTFGGKDERDSFALAANEQGFTDIGQSEITKAMSPGWNLGNQLESVDANGTPEETNWGNPVITEDLIKSVKAEGFKSIRITISYGSMIGNGPDYTVNKAWLDRIQQVVDYVVKNDLYAVINIHGDGFQTVAGGWLYIDAPGQDAIKAKFKALWQQIASRFKDYDEHLIFETMNEISDMKYEAPVPDLYKVLNSYNQIALDTIRQSGGYNDMRWVLMPGWDTDIDKTATPGIGFVIPKDTYLSKKITDPSRIMISVHYYSPTDFCQGANGEITQWGEDAKNPAKTSTHSGQNFMASRFKLLYDTFSSKGYPVVIGEYGAVDKSKDDVDNPYYREQFNYKLNENSLKYGCISMYWDNGYNTDYGFSLFDREACKVTQQGIIDAIMSVYNPTKQKGSSKGISINKSTINIVNGDNPIKLIATLKPSNSKDTIRWTSSDETVVTVSSKGVVRPQAEGTATITASANGNTAVCKVKVKPSTNCMVMLYAVETSTWSTLHSENSALITSKGGTYTLSLTGSKEVLNNIGSLFIKDVSVQSSVAKKSLITSAKIKINSFKFNDIRLNPVVKEEEVISKDSSVLDYAILNQWVENGAKIKGVTLNKQGSYMFTDKYNDSNTIEITFTISDVKMKK